MAEPITTAATAGLTLASGLLGAVADAHGLGGTGLIRRMTQRFDAAPDDAPIFFRAVWRAAVQATHGCVKQMFQHTAVTDDVRGDLQTWSRYQNAHERVRKVCGWGDDAVLPQTLDDALTRALPQALHSRWSANPQDEEAPAHRVWACYRDALRIAGFDEEPPAVVRQAFFGEREEPQVWPWSQHFALRVGESLRNDAGFKAMFDALQFAGLGESVERLIAQSEASATVLAELSGRVERVEAGVERTERNTEEVMQRQERMEQKMDELLRRTVAGIPPGAVGLNEEIERLRQRPDIRIEDLIGWLQSALDRSDPLPPEALPKLLQQALTVDLPNLRKQAEAYRLDPLASPEAQVLLDDVRALLRPQAGAPLDLQEAKTKLKALDDRIVAERAERRRREDRELAELRVLRAETERASANYAAAAELMEQASQMHDCIVSVRTMTQQAAKDWCKHGQMHPGIQSLQRSVTLFRHLINTSAIDAERADFQVLLGNSLSFLGQRLGGGDGLDALRAAERNYRAALEAHAQEAVSESWAMIHNNLANVQLHLGERLGGEVGLQALRAAEVSYRTALELHTREAMPLAWAMIHNNLGSVQLHLGERLGGAAGLQALREAETSCRAALEVRMREVVPIDWAATQNNLGNVQSRIGECLGGEVGLEALRAAEMSYRKALEVYSRETMPVDWARTQGNLGTMLLSLGERLGGMASLQALRAAEAHYRMALDVQTREGMPVAWAMTQNSLGNVQLRLGERLEGELGVQALHAAETSYCAALEVRVRKAMPVDWAMTQNNLGAVQLRLGQRLAGKAGIQALQAAEARYRAILEVNTRETMPLAWAMTQNNLGIVQLSLGQRLTGEAAAQALLSAKASHCAALQIYTRNAMPAYWQLSSENLAIVEALIAKLID